MKRVNGFTLIELLVAMVAGAMLLGSLSWVLATLGRDYGTKTSNKELNQLAALEPALTRMIEAMAVPLAGEPIPSAVQNELRFTTSPPQAMAAVGNVNTQLSVTQQADGAALQLTLAPTVAGSFFARDEMLATGLKSITIETQPRNGSGEPRLPGLVTISFATKQGEVARISAVPRQTISGTCRFDPISLTCRR
jgi:prepilin-type N-terminal cleavage/methylation domain-containing protein